LIVKSELASKKVEIIGKRMFAVFILVTALASVSAFGRQDGFFKFKADCRVEIIGEPKIHEPFEAVFTFTPLEDLVRTRGILDTAIFSTKSDAKYVKGDTLWTGLLEKGKTYSLKAWFIADDPILFLVQGSIRTKGAPGIVWHEKDTPDPGADATNGASKHIDFRKYASTEPQKPRKFHYLSDDSTGWITPYIWPYPDSISPLWRLQSPVIAKMKPETKPHKGSHKLHVPRPDTNYIDITETILKSGNTVKFNSKKINILLISPDLRNKLSIDIDSNFIIEIINDSTYLLRGLRRESIININYQGKTYSFPIELMALHNITK